MLREKGSELKKKNRTRRCKDFAINKKLPDLGRTKSMMSVAIRTTLMVSSLFLWILICYVQLRFALRIIRAKTDVPIFNQIFVLCLIASGLTSIISYHNIFIRSGDSDLIAIEHLDHLSWRWCDVLWAQTETLFCPRCGGNRQNFLLIIIPLVIRFEPPSMKSACAVPSSLAVSASYWFSMRTDSSGRIKLISLSFNMFSSITRAFHFPLVLSPGEKM